MVEKTEKKSKTTKKVTSKKPTKSTKTDKVSLTAEEIMTVAEEKNKEENKKPKKSKSNKPIKKNFKDDGIFWVANKIILRVNDKDYTKIFATDTNINKDKVGKPTKYGKDKWGIIESINEDEKELVFNIKPIER